jgi:hypothetical protein
MVSVTRFIFYRMAVIDVYNQKIIIYGTVDASFVSELEAEYTDFTTEYRTYDYDGSDR